MSHDRLRADGYRGIRIGRPSGTGLVTLADHCYTTTHNLTSAERGSWWGAGLFLFFSFLFFTLTTAHRFTHNRWGCGTVIWKGGAWDRTKVRGGEGLDFSSVFFLWLFYFLFVLHSDLFEGVIGVLFYFLFFFSVLAHIFFFSSRLDFNWERDGNGVCISGFRIHFALASTVRLSFSIMSVMPFLCFFFLYNCFFGRRWGMPWLDGWMDG